MTQKPFKVYLLENQTGLCGLLFLGVGILISPIVLYLMFEVYYWQQHGVTTQATILDKNTRMECSSAGANRSCGTVYYVDYRYNTTEEDIYESSDSIPEEVWFASVTGGELTIYYSDIAHDKSTASYVAFHKERLYMAVSILTFALVSALGGFLLIRRTKKQWLGRLT